MNNVDQFTENEMEKNVITLKKNWYGMQVFFKKL